jgi:hypothetical protein
MTRHRTNGEDTIVECLHIDLPDGFEVCWAGPNPGFPGFCFGSTDGTVLFADEMGRPLQLPLLRTSFKGSMHGAAINGVARAGTWIAVSTRVDVNLWPLPGTEGGHENGWAAPYGAHGIGTTASGYLVAAHGRNGIMVIEPPFRPRDSVTALSDSKDGLYAYRVISLLSPSGTEVLACAARTGGIAAGEFSGPQTTHKMRTATFGGLDVIDICPLDSTVPSLAAAALGRDGSVILFRDVLNDDKPLTMKFKKIVGAAYRLLCHAGELYVLTDKGMFVLAKLASRFLAHELHDDVVTQVLTMPMDAIDANLAGDHWLLVVTPDEVRRFDANWIHANVPEDVSGPDVQDFRSAVFNQTWQRHDINNTSRPLAVAS